MSGITYASRSSKKYNMFQRFFQKIWTKIDKDDVLNDAEQLAFDIFELCLNDEGNIRYLDTSESNKKYIVTKSYLLNNDINTFIILEPLSNRLTIVNHQYKYDLIMPRKTCDTMNCMFNDKVEEERENMEKEILSNITQSLDIVLKQFKEKLKSESKTDIPEENTEKQ